MERPKIREGKFAKLYYLIFLPSYAIFAFFALFRTDIVSWLPVLNRIILNLIAFYYPCIFILFAYWGMRHKSEIHKKAMPAIGLWIFGGVLLFVPLLIFFINLK